jgi:hypothetical protein
MRVSSFCDALNRTRRRNFTFVLVALVPLTVGATHA